MINNEITKTKKFNFVSLFLAISSFVFLILYYFILNILPTSFWSYIAFFFVTENTSFTEMEKIIGNLSFIGAEILTLITILIIYIKFRNDSISKKDKPKFSKLVIIGIFLGVATIILTMLSTIILGLIVGNPVVSENSKLVSEETKIFPPILITTLIIAPILEEITFKGGVFTFFHELFKDMHPVFNTFLPAIISSCVFGFLHDGINLIPIYFIPSFLGCIIYKKTGSLIPCIVGHFLNNFFVAILTFL